MNDIQKVTIGVVAAILIGIPVVWVLTASDVKYQKTFAPQYEANRRATFVQSQSYNEGMIQNLEHEHIEYVSTKDPDARAAIASTILHDYAAYDSSTLPPDLRKFVESLKAPK